MKRVRAINLNTPEEEPLEELDLFAMTDDPLGCDRIGYNPPPLPADCPGERGGPSDCDTFGGYQPACSTDCSDNMGASPPVCDLCCPEQIGYPGCNESDCWCVYGPSGEE